MQKKKGEQGNLGVWKKEIGCQKWLPVMWLPFKLLLFGYTRPYRNNT